MDLASLVKPMIAAEVYRRVQGGAMEYMPKLKGLLTHRTGYGKGNYKEIHEKYLAQEFKRRGTINDVKPLYSVLKSASTEVLHANNKEYNLLGYYVDTFHGLRRLSKRGTTKAVKHRIQYFPSIDLFIVLMRAK